MSSRILHICQDFEEVMFLDTVPLFQARSLWGPYIDELQYRAVPGLSADGRLLPDGALWVFLVQHRHTTLHLMHTMDTI